MMPSAKLKQAELRYADAVEEECKAYIALREAQERYNNSRDYAIGMLDAFNEAMKEEKK